MFSEEKRWNITSRQLKSSSEWISLNWGSFEQLALFLEQVILGKQVAKKVMVTLVELQNSSEEMGEGLPWESLSSLTDTWKFTRSWSKKHLKETERHNTPWSDETKQFGLCSKIHIWKFATCVVTHERRSVAVAAACCWGVFSLRESKIEKSTEILWMKTWFRASRTSDNDPANTGVAQRHHSEFPWAMQYHSTTTSFNCVHWHKLSTFCDTQTSL